MAALDTIVCEYHDGTVVKYYVSEEPIPEEASPVNLGWNVDGGKLEGYNRLKSLYGDPDVVRVFSGPTKGIMPWDSPILSALPNDVTLIYSVKDWPVDVYGWLSKRPGRFTKPVYFCVDHEPEQGPTRGDPDPATYQSQWRDCIAKLANHPRRSEIILTPIFTEFYAKDKPSLFESNFFVVASYEGIDAIGFDVYDESSPRYRTAEERNRIPLMYARKVDKPLVIAEWGIQKKSYDDDTQRSIVIRENMYYLRSLPDNRVKAVAWFHTDGWALDGSPTAQTAFRQMISGNA